MCQHVHARGLHVHPALHQLLSAPTGVELAPDAL
jgi:hypothetical protein